MQRGNTEGGGVQKSRDPLGPGPAPPPFAQFFPPPRNSRQSDEMTEKPKPQKARSKGGRPSFRPSVEQRRIVEEMKFCGESENTIARAIGIDPDTLRKHFADELADGHAQRRKEVIGLLFASARAGNVSAQKKLEEMGRVAGAAEAVKARETKPPKLGKKEERQIAAESVVGKYAPPTPPKLVVNNQ